MANYYILNGHDVEAVDDVLVWGKMYENFEARKVAITEIGDVRVSTVFLGMNHNWGDGPPLLFETMVFGGKLDQEQERYSTWDEAERGHAATVERVQAAI
jgi:hypothetical protein